jgi:hypothetical protein
VPVVAQAGDDAVTTVARTYREFARLEARGRSAAYEALAQSVAGDAALVIYHTSALWYVPAEQREQFAGIVRSLGATWLSSEPPGVVPGTEGPARDGHTCVLARDGRCIALTESHGTWLRWLP